ncbi:MAG TPA: hypothetical protein ENK18_20200 [Deltaproteobacteria bacterium]|nr:hypothetical protein [Deltaproteobacteria bacterium]
MIRVLPWVAAFAGFTVGIVLAFFVLDVLLGVPDAGGSRLSVVIALAPAIAGYDLTSRLLELGTRSAGRGPVPPEASG